MARHPGLRGGMRSGLLVLLLLASCAQLPERGPLPHSAALPPGESGSIDRLAQGYESAHPGRSGFMLLDRGHEAFALRALLSAEAQRSLDVQTYIWHDDLTGRYLAWELLRAADRGVRVRLLLDDLDVRARNDALVALDRHDNIEVRLYNPLASRRGRLTLAGEFLFSFHRLNHRMHVKNWIVDNRVAIAGGRNVGDEYFAASEGSNFADTDYLMIGDIVRTGSEAFDRFWNADEVYPIALLDPKQSARDDLAALRGEIDEVVERARRSPYAAALRDNESIAQLLERGLALQWAENYWMACDEPDKADAHKLLDKSAVLSALLPLLASAQRELLIVSPYFVPGEEGTKLLTELVRRGVEVVVLTNSLAANDVAAVHGGYARYRKQLLAGGVRIWELKPNSSAKTKLSLLGSSGASLHAKSLVVDRRGLFIGSYNLDPRSTALNAEMGVYVEDPVLAQQLVHGFFGDSGGLGAWEVTLVGDDLRWSDRNGVLRHEPDSSWWRRFQAWFARVMPVEPLL